MRECIRIATRASALALAQTQIVGEAIKQQCPQVDVEVKTISTAGDRDRVSPLWTMSGTGFFTTQVEQALVDGDADIAVHSFKDLPTVMNAGLTIGAVLERQFPEDVFVTSRHATRVEQLPDGAVVGTSSPRRTALLKCFRPDLNVQLIRGNVETRLQKVADGDYDAVILARAGLERLGLSEKISFVLDPGEFIPAPAQGALAVQCRSGDAEIVSLLAGINHAPTQTVVEAERRVLSALHPGCHAPVGVHASLDGDSIHMVAFVADIMAAEFIGEQVSGLTVRADETADALIERLMAAGAEDILKGYRTDE